MFSVTFFVSRLVDTYSWWNVNDSDSVQLIGYGSVIFIFLMCLLNVHTKNHVINNVDMCFHFFYLAS